MTEQLFNMPLEVLAPIDEAIPGAATALQAAATCGGFVLLQGTKAVVGDLAKRGVYGLFGRLRQAQERGDVQGDFENTSHGQSMIQEAMRALMEGLDEERVEAVHRVFVGLAENPPKDSIQAAEQLYILRIVSELDTMELVAISLLERYRLAVRDPELNSRFLTATDHTDAHQEVFADSKCKLTFVEWLRNEKLLSGSQRTLLANSIASLHEKGLFADRTINLEPKYFEVQPQGRFTDVGQAIVKNLAGSWES